jgi:hypothetical protein
VGGGDFLIHQTPHSHVLNKNLLPENQRYLNEPGSHLYFELHAPPFTIKKNLIFHAYDFPLQKEHTQTKFSNDTYKY